jgi:hypothetical protein
MSNDVAIGPHAAATTCAALRMTADSPTPAQLHRLPFFYLLRLPLGVHRWSSELLDMQRGSSATTASTATRWLIDLHWRNGFPTDIRIFGHYTHVGCTVPATPVDEPAHGADALRPDVPVLLPHASTDYYRFTAYCRVARTWVDA